MTKNLTKDLKDFIAGSILIDVEVYDAEDLQRTRDLIDTLDLDTSRYVYEMSILNGLEDE